MHLSYDLRQGLELKKMLQIFSSLIYVSESSSILRPLRIMFILNKILVQMVINKLQIQIFNKNDKKQNNLSK